jgi:hypothetical protein
MPTKVVRSQSEGVLPGNVTPQGTLALPAAIVGAIIGLSALGPFGFALGVWLGGLGGIYVRDPL